MVYCYFLPLRHSDNKTALVPGVHCTKYGESPTQVAQFFNHIASTWVHICVMISGCLIFQNTVLKYKMHSILIVWMRYFVLIYVNLLYGCEAWSLTLREKRRLRVFEKMILRWIFEPKRDANGEWRRLHNEELHTLHRSPNIVRVIKSSRSIARMDEGRNDFKMLEGKPTGKKHIERPKRR